jgi:transcriptional regulator with XRE-family HTH domain
MRASSKLPSEERPTKYVASGLQAAREAASMTIQEVADACGYDPGTIASMERGAPYHTVSISRVSSVIEGHDLSQIRDEGD